MLNLMLMFYTNRIRVANANRNVFFIIASRPFSFRMTVFIFFF